MAELFEMPAQLRLIDFDLPLQPSGAPPDWKQRERALDVRSSWIVEAPAGSGKTGLLIQRFLKLLAEGGVDRPEQVLAITFTRAATEEIRERIMAELESAAAGSAAKGAFTEATRELARAVLGRSATLGWNLLDSPRRLNVRTIDSVCAEIARALPVTSGGSAGANPVDEPAAMYREAAQRMLLHLGGDDALLTEALRTMLLHRDGSVADCEALIAEMLGARDQWGELVPIGREELTEQSLETTVRGQLDRALELEVCRGLSDLAQAIPESTLQEITVLAAEIGHAPAYGHSPSPMAICAGLTKTPGEALEHLEHWQALIHLLVKNDGEWRAGFRSDWLRFTWDKRHTTPIKGLIASLQDQPGVLEAIQRFNSLPPARYPEEQWLVAKALFRVMSRALVELQFVFAERGECDFAEPALLARAALRQASGVEGFEAATGLELRHLLVDEMQDTSSSQYELIELLTEGWANEAKTVFLVGDPKQSIYLFRQARVERFIETMRTGRMGSLPVERLRLTANFRSQAGLVRAFNADFARVFPSAGSHEGEVPFAAAEAVREDTAGLLGLSGESGSVWHTALAGGGRAECTERKRRVARQDAVEIRRVLEQWRARPLPAGRLEPWRTAVLVRSRRDLREIVATLKEDRGHGSMPFRAVEVEPLRERREVLDLLALTRALKHPGDRVAWWAVLHAPWCGLGLADLHLLAGADDPAYKERTVMELVAERGDRLGTEAIARLERVWPVLEAALARRSRLRVPELVERTWRSLGGDAPLSDTETANAVQFLDLLDRLDRETGGVDTALLERRMHRLFAAPASVEDAPELMTIHGAKGLEWDVVMVPELGRRAQISRHRLLEWEEIGGPLEDGGARVVLAPIEGRGEESKALNRWLRGIRSAREAAERRRLLYVACTRAREELHLFGTANISKDGAVKAESGSLLEAAWPAAEDRFRAIAQSDARSAQSEESDESKGLALAAAADAPEPRPAMLERLPLSFIPINRFEHNRPFAADAIRTSRVRFELPAGSFAARSFGNAVHTFLEQAALRLLAGDDAGRLQTEVPRWRSQAAAVLRGDGLAPAVVERLAGRVIVALTNTLEQHVGRWLLGARADAASEYALTTSVGSTVRMDRVFRAGELPESEGSACLWIVDYKTGSHGAEGVDAFLKREQLKHAAQMEGYARASGEAGVRVGLWYPMLGRLVWWVV